MWWFCSAKRWKRWCRVLTGNTTPECDGVERVWVWNAQKLAMRACAAGGSSSSGQKWDWVCGELGRDDGPWVWGLLEVEGSRGDIYLLRKRMHACGYRAVILRGELDPGSASGVPRWLNCVVILLRSGAVSLVDRPRRLAARVFSVRYRRTGGAAGVARRAVVMHGLHAEDAVSGDDFSVQVAGVAAVARGGGLLLGDFNHVLCAAWRRVGYVLAAGDRELRALGGSVCRCCLFMCFV